MHTVLQAKYTAKHSILLIIFSLILASHQFLYVDGKKGYYIKSKVNTTEILKAKKYT